MFFISPTLLIVTSAGLEDEGYLFSHFKNVLPLSYTPFHCLLASIVAIEKTAVNGVVLFLGGSVFPFWLLSSFCVVVLQLDYSMFRRGVFFILPALGLVGILESEDWCLSLILEKFQSNSIKSWLFLIICSPSETSIKLLLDGPHHSTLHLP